MDEIKNQETNVNEMISQRTSFFEKITTIFSSFFVGFITFLITCIFFISLEFEDSYGASIQLFILFWIIGIYHFLMMFRYHRLLKTKKYSELIILLICSTLVFIILGLFWIIIGSHNSILGFRWQ